MRVLGSWFGMAIGHWFGAIVGQSARDHAAFSLYASSGARFIVVSPETHPERIARNVRANDHA